MILLIYLYLGEGVWQKDHKAATKSLKFLKNKKRLLYLVISK